MPHILVLKFPKITPSGFIIGTTLIMQFYLSLNASGFSEVIHFKNPSITKLEFDSPGCCRPIINIHFLFLLSPGFVIVNKGIYNPLKESPKDL